MSTEERLRYLTSRELGRSRFNFFEDLVLDEDRDRTIEVRNGDDLYDLDVLNLEDERGGVSD